MFTYPQVFNRTDDKKSYILDTVEVNSGGNNVVYDMMLLKLNRSKRLHVIDLLYLPWS